MSTVEPELRDYVRWSSRNDERNFSLYDYVYGVLKSKSLSSDFLVGALRLCWPKFTEYEGLVILEEQLSETKIEQLKAQGQGRREIEYWSNLFCVDGLLEGIRDATDEHIVAVASILRAAWASKLKADFPGRKFQVEVIDDQDAGDTCVTFYQRDQPEGLSEGIRKTGVEDAT